MIRLNEKGQSLVEALIALGVATIVVAAMAVAAITAVNNSDFSKYQDLATNYAQQGLEVLRQRSQTDWSNKFYNYLGQSCLDQNNNLTPLPPLGACVQNLNGQNGNPFFVRTVVLTQTASLDLDCHGAVRATVSVTWSDGKCSGGAFCHNVTLKSCFVNING